MASREQASTNEMEPCPYTVLELEEKAARLKEVCNIFEATGGLGEAEKAELPALSVRLSCVSSQYRNVPN